MVLLGGAMVCSCKLSIQITIVSGTVWPQFAIQVLSGTVSPQFGGRSGRRGLEMHPLNSLVMTFYRLSPIMSLLWSIHLWADCK